MCVPITGETEVEGSVRLEKGVDEVEAEWRVGRFVSAKALLPIEELLTVEAVEIANSPASI